MKKITFLLSLFLLLVGVNAKAQTDWWRTRAESFNADSYYLIFNAHNDRYQYLYDNNGTFGSNHTKPSELSVDDLTSAYLFKFEVQDADANTYFIKTYEGKYVNLDGNTTNESGYTLTLTPFVAGYGSGDDIYSALAEADDAVVSNANITADDHLFRVQNGLAGWGWNASNTTTFGTWSVCHPFAFYEVPETFVESLTATQNHDALEAAMAEYLAVINSVTPSDAPGCYSQTNVFAAMKAINDASEVLSTGDEAACAEALETLNNTMNGLQPNPITAGLYKIVSAYSGFETKQGVKKAIYSNYAGTNFAWKSVDDNDKTFYWNITVNTDGTLLIQNAATGAYFSGTGVLAETASNVTFDLVAVGQYNINMGSGNFHANGHGNGSGVSGNIIIYGGGANGASAWALEPVTAIPEAAEKAWELIVAKNSEEYVELKELMAGNMQDWATACRSMTGLITSADQLYSAYDHGICNPNATSDNAGVGALIDGDLATYFHSAYGGTIPAGYHNLEVSFDAPVGDFCFYFYARNSGGTYANNRPQKVSVYGSTDGGTNYTKIRTIEYDLPLPTSVNAGQMQSLWGIIEGGEYTKFRFDVEAANTSGAFFTAAEFQMYAVPAEGDAKTVAETLDAYFSIAKIDDINALADALIYNDEAAATLLADAQTAIAKTGIGYPKADDATRAPLAAAIAADKATLGNKAYIQALQEALDAYKRSVNVELPVNGKAYKIYANYASKTPQPLYFNGTRITAKNEEKIKDKNSMIFVCRQLSNGQYVLVNNAGKYLIWCDSGAEQQAINKSVSSDGYTDVYQEKNAWTIGTPNQFGEGYYHFGMLFLHANCKDNVTRYFNARWEGDTIDCQFIAGGENGWFYDPAGTAKERTPLFSFEEVSYPNSLTLSAPCSELYLGTFSAPFPTVVPEGVKAYEITGTKSKEGTTYAATKLLADEGEAIPAGTGVLLATAEADKAVCMLPATTEAQAAATANMLQATGSAGVTVDAATTAYILANKNNAAAFYLLNDTERTLPAAKAYLTGITANTVLKLSFGSDVTGIEEVETAEADNAPVYDLSGRQVANPVKGGIYIQGGKKFIVK